MRFIVEYAHLDYVHIVLISVFLCQTDKRLINSTAISPIVEQGDAQDTMDVTTSGKANRFDSRFFHLVFEEQFE